WRGFLALLKTSRPRQPLNGALVTVSVSDLLSQDAAARAQYAAHVRARVAELYEQLGVRFPIYIMVTKSDLLAGFMEFFGDLDREAREQVWGTTFASTPDATPVYAEAFAAEFAQLEQRLNAVLLGRLHEERDPQRRALAYSFPQQFSALGPLLSTFVEQAFGAAGGAPALLRGVYLTSGTQEGRPIDRVLGTLARAFQLEQKVLPPAASSGKSYFLNQMLRQVVFPEAGLAGLDARFEARRRRLLAGAWIACGAVTLMLFAAWTLSFVANRSLVADAQARVVAAKAAFDALPGAPAGEPAAVLSVLDALHDLPRGYGARNAAVPFTQRFGLHPHELAERERQAYRRAAAELLLPRIAIALERAIATTVEPRERERLEADYAMLFDDARIEPKALAVAAVTVLTGADATSLEKHLRAALELRPVARGVPRNAALTGAVNPSK
ncbi:MAG: type VI secretion system membrane subunit TssM, partial [Proteobacteria bacterium]|nr:type VI secretion system membrane subunit TssM [Pseudomonadota bacterium]